MEVDDDIDVVLGAVHLDGAVLGDRLREEVQVIKKLTQLRLILREEDKVLDVVADCKRAPELLTGHQRAARIQVVRTPDVRDPKEAESGERLRSVTGVDLQHQIERLLIRPSAERREEHEQQRHHNEHRKTAAELGNAALLHELPLFRNELLLIVAVFLFQPVKFRLNRLHLNRRLAGFDVGEDRQQLDGKRKQEYRQNDDPSAGRKQTAHLPIDPVHRLKQPFDEEKG